eukprot:Nk52_evm13s303 gene=Nk52_evmTU13s303
MSGYPPPGGYNNYPPPPGGNYPPPPGGNYPPPPGGNYPPPPGGGFPPQGGPGYPPQQGGYGMPQPQPTGYGAVPPPMPQQPGFAPGGPPPAQYGAPPPSQGYGMPPQQQQYQQQPPQQPYGQYQQPPAPQGGYAPQQHPPQGPPPQNYQQQPPAAPQQQSPRQPPARPPQPAASDVHAVATGPKATVFHGTVVPAPGFDAERDAETLRKAMKGFGTDEKAIISVLAHRSTEQRVRIKIMFKQMYGKDLVKELKSELSSHFEDCCVALLKTSAEYDAYSLRHAMKGMGTDEKVLIEIICTRTNQQLKEIVAQYKLDYARDLEKDIVSETSGHFKRILVSCLQAHRDESQDINMDKVKKDAQDLYQAGEKKWGTDESKFNMILATRSYDHLRAVFNEYIKISGRDIERAIEKEMSGNLEDGMKAVVKTARNRPEFFAERLHKAMKGMGTDDKSLLRIIISRCEVDMVEIKQEYSRLYKVSLAHAIEKDTSGDYKRILVAMVGGH